jgi:hypothetical protein
MSDASFDFVGAKLRDVTRASVAANTRKMAALMAAGPAGSAGQPQDPDPPKLTATRAFRASTKSMTSMHFPAGTVPTTWTRQTGYGRQ